MWAKVAEEMQVPWRAAEAMHWQLGEADMARRAGVTPFSLTATTIEASSSHSRRSPPNMPYQHHHHSQSGFRTDPGSGGGSSSSGAPSPHYGRGSHQSVPLPPPPLSMHGISSGSVRGFAPGMRHERGSTPGRAGAVGGGPSDPANTMYHYHQHSQQQLYQHAGPGLPPIQATGGPPPPSLLQQERPGVGGGVLPSFAEITTGVSPYSTPAYSLGTSPAPSTTESPGPGSGPSYSLSGTTVASAYSMGYGPGGGVSESLSAAKRRASPIFEPREQRRRYQQSPRFDDGRGGSAPGSGGYHRG